MKDIKNIVIFGTGAVAAEITSQLEDSSWGEEAGIKIKGYVASDAVGLQHWKEYKYQSPYLGDFLNYEIKAEDYFVLALGNYKGVKVYNVGTPDCHCWQNGIDRGR